MKNDSFHRLYRHFQELPISMRVLFSSALMVLGLGYAFAALYVFAAHSGADGEPGLSVEDIKITYSGNAETTQLETALRGAMSGMLPQRELSAMLSWIRDGADKAAYTSDIETIVADNCLGCHDGSNPHLSNLDGYENIQTVVAVDTGADLYTLVRVSHIHLFGLTFIFFLIGFIFSHAYVRPVWLKSLVIAAPFAGVIIDVLGWYITKVYSPFAWGVLIAGLINGLSFAVMWSISMYQMWFYKLPDHVRLRHGGDPDSDH
ncbi:MAG TPA: hypothetical protein VJ984_08355 [Xanthomonadales bacterium]|nr:hypothetical protein [Xanthomonadales bacterium]